jgi:hypothetical protein
MSLNSVINSLSKDIPDNYRCYEFMRVLSARLKSDGIESSVKNGIVSYLKSYLLERFISEDKDLEMLALSVKEKYAKQLSQKINVYSSWCQVGNVMVTREMCIDAGKDLVLQNMTILGTAAELKGKIDFYEAFSKEFSAFGSRRLYISPCFLTSLRMPSAEKIRNL